MCVCVGGGGLTEGKGGGVERGCVTRFATKGLQLAGRRGGCLCGVGGGPVRCVGRQTRGGSFAAGAAKTPGGGARLECARFGEGWGVGGWGGGWVGGCGGGAQRRGGLSLGEFLNSAVQVRRTGIAISMHLFIYFHY